MSISNNSNIPVNIPDNQLSNWSVGTPFLRNKSMEVMLTKSTNSRSINRSQVHKKIYLILLSNTSRASFTIDESLDVSGETSG